MENTRSIYQTAVETGLSADTLRYYERIGLISDIERDPGGRRRYAEKDITWIMFLKQLRATGMPIAQMQRFAQLRRDGDGTVPQRREMLEQHRRSLEAQVRAIMDFMAAIDTKIARHKHHEQARIGEMQNEPNHEPMA